MDKQKASRLLAILGPIILIATLAIGAFFPKYSIFMIGGVIIVLAVVASRLKR